MSPFSLSPRATGGIYVGECAGCRSVGRPRKRCIDTVKEGMKGRRDEREGTKGRRDEREGTKGRRDEKE